MMVLEVIAAGSCNGMELVIGKRMAELSAGCCKSIVEVVVRIVHLIDLEHSLQTSFIEAGIVGHKRNGSYLVAEIINCLLLCITIIGIPWGKMHFRLAKLALSPFGMEVV